MARVSGRKLLHKAATRGGEEVASVDGLKCRNGRWTLRVRVPDPLRPIIGKRELWKSFGAVSFAEACREARIERVRIDQQFAQARSALGGKPVEDISDSELIQLSRAFLGRMEAEAAPVPFDPDEREALAQANMDDLGAIAQGYEDASVQRVALDLAKWARLNVQPDSLAFLRLTQGVHRALIEHHLRQADRLELTPAKPHDPIFVGTEPNGHVDPPLTLERAVQLYKSAPERSGNAPKTRAADEFRFAVIIELLGAKKNVAELTRNDIREARDLLLRIPPNAAKRFRGTPLRVVADIADKEGLPRMSAKSAMLYIECISALFRWLMQEEMTARNPAQGLRGPPVPKATRRPFTVAEANTLFRSGSFNGANGKDWLFWLPRVAIFTGMRLGEIAGLRACDLVVGEETAFFDVRDNEFRTLKNAQSARIIPVHSKLREIGLLKHAEDLPPHGLLFPGQPSGGEGTNNATQKKIGRLIRSVHPDPALVFHSFRHTFKDAMLEAELPSKVAEALGGWRDGGSSSMDGYGRGYREQKLAEWMEQIAYPGLHLVI